MADGLHNQERLVALLGVIQHQLHHEYHRAHGDEEYGASEDDKHISGDRLNELLEIIFPGKNVTITDESGKTLFNTKEQEAEEAEEEGEGPEGEASKEED